MRSKQANQGSRVVTEQQEAGRASGVIPGTVLVPICAAGLLPALPDRHFCHISTTSLPHVARFRCMGSGGSITAQQRTCHALRCRS